MTLDQRFDEMKANLAVIDKRLDRLQAAAKLTLLFYASGSWTMEQKADWKTLLSQCYPQGKIVKNMEATIKVLCDAVRAALEN